MPKDVLITKVLDGPPVMGVSNTRRYALAAALRMNEQTNRTSLGINTVHGAKAPVQSKRQFQPPLQWASQLAPMQLLMAESLGRMTTAVCQLYLYVALYIANVSCVAISSFQSVSQLGSLHSPASSGLHNTSISSQLLNLTRHHRLLNAGLTFECSPTYGRNLKIDSVMSAWGHIPRDREPMTFGHKGEPDVHLPKRFLGRMYRVHLYRIQEFYQLTKADSPLLWGQLMDEPSLSSLGVVKTRMFLLGS